jgi:hypothetical protein
MPFLNVPQGHGCGLVYYVNTGFYSKPVPVALTRVELDVKASSDSPKYIQSSVEKTLQR